MVGIPTNGRYTDLSGSPELQIKNFCKKLKYPAAAPSELGVLEHHKHGVKHGQLYHVALNLPPYQVIPLELVFFCLDEAQNRK